MFIIFNKADWKSIQIVRSIKNYFTNLISKKLIQINNSLLLKLKFK